MDKKQALQELKELQARASALEAIINAPDEPTTFCGYHLKENDESGVEQWYVSVVGNITRSTCVSSTDAKYGLAFKTRLAAEQHLKQLELHQKCRFAMAKDWGDITVTWSDKSDEKYVLRPITGFRLTIDCYRETYHPFHFRTEQAARDFVRSLTPEETQVFLRGADV